MIGDLAFCGAYVLILYTVTYCNPLRSIHYITLHVYRQHYSHYKHQIQCMRIHITPSPSLIYGKFIYTMFTSCKSTSWAHMHTICICIFIPCVMLVRSQAAMDFGNSDGAQHLLHHTTNQPRSMHITSRSSSGRPGCAGEGEGGSSPNPPAPPVKNAETKSNPVPAKGNAEKDDNAKDDQAEKDKEPKRRRNLNYRSYTSSLYQFL